MEPGTGPWCWERLTPELHRRGHKVVGVELPSDDAAATFSSYAEAIVESMEAEPAGAVLVAHSMAGLSVPIAASCLPVRAVVFVCGLIALPGRSLVDQFVAQPHMLVPGYDDGLTEPDDQGRSQWVDFGGPGRRSTTVTRRRRGPRRSSPTAGSEHLHRAVPSVGAPGHRIRVRDGCGGSAREPRMVSRGGRNAARRHADRAAWKSIRHFWLGLVRSQKSSPATPDRRDRAGTRPRCRPVHVERLTIARRGDRGSSKLTPRRSSSVDSVSVRGARPSPTAGSRSRGPRGRDGRDVEAGVEHVTQVGARELVDLRLSWTANSATHRDRAEHADDASRGRLGHHRSDAEQHCHRDQRQQDRRIVWRSSVVEQERERDAARVHIRGAATT